MFAVTAVLRYLTVPSTNTELAKQALLYAAPTLCRNALPATVPNWPSLDVFRARLKTLLFSHIHN